MNIPTKLPLRALRPPVHLTLHPLSILRRPLRFSLRTALLVAALFLLPAFASAAYLINVPQVLRQPNGETLRCFASGDEYYNWLHDRDGYTIVQHPITGYYVYAESAPGGDLRPSAFIAGKTNPAASGLSKGLRMTPPKISRLRDDILRMQTASDPTPAPRTGTINNLVVFIRFQGEGEFTDAPSTFTQMLNAPGSSDNSMFNYFREASYTRLAVQSTLYPTPSTTVLSFQDANPRAYYQPYNLASNPTGYQGGDNGTERTNREHTLLSNAVSSIAAQVPSGLVVDGDGDGRVDNIVFIVSGSPTGWASLLWPHAWALYSQFAYINSKRVYTYNLQLRSTIGTGVLCHEMFHSIGAPDLYHYTGNGIAPVGWWDIMENNANPPQHMGAFMKWRYGTWISSIPEITTAGIYTLNPLTSATGNCFKICSPNSTTEYFLLEYRRRTGTFETSLPGEGLLVYRINTVRDGRGNSSGPPDEVYIYRPNGTTTVNGQVSNAVFSSTSGRTVINDSTNPSSFLSTGGAGGLSIANVGSPGSTISFEVRFPPTIQLSRNKLNFGAMAGAGPSADQTVTVSNAGLGTLNWTASPSQTWIAVSPSSGTGAGTLNIHVLPAGLAAGGNSGTVSVASTEATNSPLNITIALTVYAAGTSAAPFGTFDTPAAGSTVRSSIAVTGWALDDVETTVVKLSRDPAGAEPPGSRVFIGNATFVEGARPDVETAYPNHPLNARAGWGYMLLTNFLPGGGNGIITLYAYATDKEGHEVVLGSKTITIDNAHAVKPFGAIDTPAQGEEISGSGYFNFGWALTPMPNSIPADGSTMGVWVDGVWLGRPTYNHYRADVANAFPGYANSNGAVGVFTLDTTAFSNGVHTIAWSVRDNAGNEDGIGSRYFSILNTGSPAPQAELPAAALNKASTLRSSAAANTVAGGRASGGSLAAIGELSGFRDVSMNPIHVRRGYDRSQAPDLVIPPPSFGIPTPNPVLPALREGSLLILRELERIEILLDEQAWAADADRRMAERAGFVSAPPSASRNSNQSASLISVQSLSQNSGQSTSRYEGYLIVGSELRPLPIGSSLDAAAGIFSWLPGPGFLGDYRLVFVDRNSRSKIFLTIRIGEGGET